MRIFFFFLILSTAAFGAQLTCSTQNKVDGWQGYRTFDFISFKGLAIKEDEISIATINGAFLAKEGLVKKDKSYKNANPRYNNYDRYQLADAWHSFNILLPKKFLSTSFYNRFDGYIQIVNDDTGGTYVHILKCGLH